MKIKLNIDEVKYALLVNIFSKTGMRLQPEEVDITEVEVNKDAANDLVSALDITLTIPH
ncbi:hypothetical protein [Paenibacillus sp. UMB4589-SE434]|uniref:hypothetical protein n=1 Tax=Paenibacillus sp. UMB4589-SE434 TaxID=3046314 RepID=UPI00254F9C1F|nr:hypothetical protein [Paenibacillus sp. UMB4589-SE434]MDK8182096.1 hypothetical protein [Paenibacillus sp. UMB4589-SE434]